MVYVENYVNLVNRNFKETIWKFFVMSTQRGNVHRSRPQKHQNRTVFKNDRHDTNIRTKRINQIQIANVCAKCKAVLEWKIKYKKYKLIKTPRTCNKCNQKTVKQPYHTVCSLCARSMNICPKCEVSMNYEDDFSNQNPVVDNENEKECKNHLFNCNC